MSETDQYFKKLTDDHVKRIASEANKDQYVINGKTYQRRKITVKEFNKLEKARAAFALEKDADKATDLLANLYKDAAVMYLGMAEEDYFNAPWEDTKLAIDACNFRTLYGAPFLSNNSTNSSG